MTDLKLIAQIQATLRAHLQRWDECRLLEEALTAHGFNCPDNISDILDEVAAGIDEVDGVNASHAAAFLQQIQPA